MRNKPLCDETKEVLMRLVDDGLITVEHIPGVAPTSLSTVQKLRREWLGNGGQLRPTTQGASARRSTEPSPALRLAVLHMLALDPGAPPSEIQDYLEGNNKIISLPDIDRILNEEGLLRKAAATMAHHEPSVRMKFMLRMTQYKPEQLVFVGRSRFEIPVANRKIVRGQSKRRRTNDTPQVEIYTLLSACSLSEPLFGECVLKGANLFKHSDALEIVDGIEGGVLPMMQPFPNERSILVVQDELSWVAEGLIDDIESKGEFCSSKTNE